MAAAAQPVTMLVIDKKILPMKDAGLPKQVMDQTPKKYQKAKIPVVKAKIGPQIMNLICDDAIYDDVPTKGECKAMVSGIYVISIKSVRRKNAPVEPEDGKKKKKSFQQKMRAKQAEYQKQLNDEILARNQEKEKKAKSKTSAADKKKAEARAKKITDDIK